MLRNLSQLYTAMLLEPSWPSLQIVECLVALFTLARGKSLGLCTSAVFLTTLQCFAMLQLF